jgi:hypothetical protein
MLATAECYQEKIGAREIQGRTPNFCSTRISVSVPEFPSPRFFLPLYVEAALVFQFFIDEDAVEESLQ